MPLNMKASSPLLPSGSMLNSSNLPERLVNRYQFSFAVEPCRSNSWPVFFGASCDAIYFFKVGAIHTKPFMRILCINISAPGVEFWAAH